MEADGGTSFGFLDQGEQVPENVLFLLLAGGIPLGTVKPPWDKDENENRSTCSLTCLTQAYLYRGQGRWIYVWQMEGCSITLISPNAGFKVYILLLIQTTQPANSGHSCHHRELKNQAGPCYPHRPARCSFFVPSTLNLPIASFGSSRLSAVVFHPGRYQDATVVDHLAIGNFASAEGPIPSINCHLVCWYSVH